MEEDISIEFNSPHIVLAVSFAKGHLGAAYYDSTIDILFLMEDTVENDSFGILDLSESSLVQPSVLLHTARSEEDLIKNIEKGLLFPLNLKEQIKIDTRPSAEFSYDNGRKQLLHLKINDEQLEWMRESDFLHYLSSIVNLNHRQMVSSAGAVLAFLARNNNRLTDRITINGIEQFNVNSFMHVNKDTIMSLQIFLDKVHPNMHNSQLREGLSLFKLLNSTKSPSGTALLKSWFMYPCLDIDVINTRQDAVAFLLQPDQKYLCDQLSLGLRHIKHIQRALSMMKKKPKPNDWKVLMELSYFGLKMRTHLLESELQSEYLKRILEQISANDLRDLGTMINTYIDFDESESEDRFVVKHNVDEELDEMKRAYAGLDDLLSEVARDEVHKVPINWRKSLSVVYFPQLGYLISLPLSDYMIETDDYKVEPLEFQFATDSNSYYKNPRMNELDETLGDLHSNISDREIEIMHRLCETVLEYKDILLTITNAFAELDCLVSLTNAARKYRYTRPMMTTDNILNIKKGRHPILEQITDAFIPNDVNLKKDGPKLVLLTGPNSSGKSVYLKQVALIVYMAHIGSFVPAQESLIGITDKILTRITTRESVTDSASSFMLDLYQTQKALKNSTSRSLILLDEFGKGTTSTDGIGLFAAVLESFASRGQNCPNIIAATHFHEIYSLNLNVPDLLVSECMMEFLPSSESHCYLYRVVPGRSESSWGLVVAKAAGIPDSIIKMAKSFASKSEEYKIISQYEAKEDDGRFMIQCDDCQEWYHGKCVGISAAQGRNIEKYHCPTCAGISWDTVKKRKVYHSDGSAEVSDASDLEVQASNRKVKKPPPPSVIRRKDHAPLLSDAASLVQIKKRAGIQDKKQPKSSNDIAARALARKGFEATFKNIFDDVKGNMKKYVISEGIDLDDPRAFAIELEEELFNQLSIVKPDQSVECGSAYKDRYRSLQFNLKDKRNIRLKEKVLKGELTPASLVKLPSEELASEDFKNAVESIQQSNLKTVFKASSLKNSNPSYKRPRVEEAVIVPEKKKINQVSLASVALSKKKAETLDDILAKMDKGGSAKDVGDMEHSSSKTEEEEPADRNDVIWKGRLSMPQVGKFKGYARQVGGRWVGNEKNWLKILTDSLSVEGRIPVSRAGDYIRGQASSKEIVVIEILPGAPDDEESSSSQDLIEYRTLLDYFSSRQRYGVLPNRHENLKDMYLVPLGKDDPLPDFVRVLNHVSLQESIPRVSDSLLAVLILKYQTWSSNSFNKGKIGSAMPPSSGTYVPKIPSTMPAQLSSVRVVEKTQTYNPPNASGLLANLISGTSQGQQQPIYSGRSLPQQPMALGAAASPATNVSLLLAQLQGVIPSFGDRPPNAQ